MRGGAGRVRASAEIDLRPDFGAPAPWRRIEQGWVAGLRERDFALWSSFPMSGAQDGLCGEMELSEGEEAWIVAGLGLRPAEWSPAYARAKLSATEAWWRRTERRLTYTGKYNDAVKRAALTMHLLSFAPTGAIVAAPTTSLLERLCGDRNYDYRFPGRAMSPSAERRIIVECDRNGWAGKCPRHGQISRVDAARLAHLLVTLMGSVGAALMAAGPDGGR